MRFFQTPILVFLTATSSTIFSLTAFSQQASPTEDAHATLIAGKHRSVIAYAGTRHSFTLEVNAKTAKLSDVPGFINIDHQILQSTLVPVDPSINLSQLTPAREQNILTGYMNFELAYYKKKLHLSYINLVTQWITLQNRLFLIWYFDLPENDKLISRQIYASTLFFDQIMDLNAPVFKKDDPGKAKTLLLQLISTIKIYDSHLDLVALQKKLAKG